MNKLPFSLISAIIIETEIMINLKVFEIIMFSILKQWSINILASDMLFERKGHQ